MPLSQGESTAARHLSHKAFLPPSAAVLNFEPIHNRLRVCEWLLSVWTEMLNSPKIVFRRLISSMALPIAIFPSSDLLDAMTAVAVTFCVLTAICCTPVAISLMVFAVFSTLLDCFLEPSATRCTEAETCSVAKNHVLGNHDLYTNRILTQCRQ